MLHLKIHKSSTPVIHLTPFGLIRVLYKNYVGTLKTNYLRKRKKKGNACNNFFDY